MRFRKPPEEDQEAAAITRLVDDPAAAADRPEIAGQRRVAQALRAGGPTAPDRLLSAVEAKVREAYGPAPARPKRSRRPAIAVGGLAAIAAAVVIAVVLVSGGASGPSIPAAAKLAFAPSTGPAPTPKNATLLDASYGGVTFPNYANFAVHPTGTRTDRIGGRPALTVFYRLRDGARLSYTVFSGQAVPLPSSARSVTYRGVPLKTFSTSSGLSVVTLVRYGRTCVLAAPTKADVVLGLAAAPVLEQPVA